MDWSNPVVAFLALGACLAVAAIVFLATRGAEAEAAKLVDVVGEGSNVPRRFREKPVTIEAMQFTGGAANATPIVDWVLKNDGTAAWSEAYDEWVSEDGFRGYPAQEECLTIKTSEDIFKAPVGWWIIRDVEGEFYACRPDIFRKTYEIG